MVRKKLLYLGIILISLDLFACKYTQVNKQKPKPEPLVEEEQIIPRKTTTDRQQTFEPLVFRVYCGIGKVKFKNEYWDQIFLACDAFEGLDNACIQIQGYASDDGPHEYNVKLAGARAEWVKRCLLAEQIDSKYITVEAMGPIEIEAEADKQETAKCRRVEIHLVPCDAQEPRGMNQPRIDPQDPFHYAK